MFDAYSVTGSSTALTRTGMGNCRPGPPRHNSKSANLSNCRAGSGSTSPLPSGDEAETASAKGCSGQRANLFTYRAEAARSTSPNFFAVNKPALLTTRHKPYKPAFVTTMPINQR